jgi:SAM-dependent methyltransferase
MSEAEREAWNARHGDAAEPGQPSAFLLSLDAVLPRSGRALDVAGGRGRHALWLARRGLDVTLADVSDVAISIAASEARAAGLDIQTLRMDLTASPRLPPGPWDLLVSFYFLSRPLFATYAEALAPGGWLVVAHPTKTNLTRHVRPNPEYVLENGELVAFASGLEVLAYDEAWFEEGRHEARLVARMPPQATRRAMSGS